MFELDKNSASAADNKSAFIDEAYSTGFQSSAATAALAVTTSALDPRKDWTVVFSTSNNSGASKVQFQFSIDESQIIGNSSATVSYSF